MEKEKQIVLPTWVVTICATVLIAIAAWFFNVLYDGQERLKDDIVEIKVEIGKMATTIRQLERKDLVRLNVDK